MTLSLSEVPPAKLGALMSEACDAWFTWDAGDLRQMLQHQLSTPLIVDLGGGPGQVEDQSLLQTTFGEQLLGDAPDPALLQLIKNFAKSRLSADDGSLPTEIALILYYGAIVVARQHGHAISRLTDDELVRGLDRVLQWPWLSPPIKEVLIRHKALLARET